MQELRAAYYGMGQDALEALRRALRTSADGKIAYQLLADIGVVPTLEDRQRTGFTPNPDDESGKPRMWIGRFIQCAIQRAIAFGESTDELEKGLENLGLRIDQKTGAVVPIAMREISSDKRV